MKFEVKPLNILVICTSYAFSRKVNPDNKTITVYGMGDVEIGTESALKNAREKWGQTKGLQVTQERSINLAPFANRSNFPRGYNK